MARAKITDQSEKKNILRPPSKKMKFDFSKKSGETKKKKKKHVKPSINSPVLNKITSLPSETKTITSDLKPNAAIEEDEEMQESFRKHYVKNIAEQLAIQKIFNLH